jgi:putative AbiEii toxin of type IV toxin-antitoxin system
MRPSQPTGAYLGSRPPWGLAGWEFGYFHGDDLDKDNPVASWVAKLKEKGPDTEGFGSLLDGLADSRLVALEPAGVEDGERIWNVSWCLETFDDLPGEAQTALLASPLLPFSERRERAERAKRGEGGVYFTRGMYIPIHGKPRHMWVDGAPVVVAPIGQTRAAHLPRGLLVPTEADRLRRTVADAVKHLVTETRYGLEDARREGDPLTADEQAARAAPRNWLEPADQGWRVHPDARAAASFIAAAANRLLPTFLSDRYRLVAALRPLELWVEPGGQPLDLRLELRYPDGRVEDFPVEQVADGFGLLVQLALLEACEQAARIGAILGDVAGDWWVRAEPASHAHSIEDPDADGWEREAAYFEEVFERMIEDLHAIDADKRPWLEGELAERLAAAGSENWTRRGARHRRFFVVDEPERHLHPALQREVARWLKDTAASREAPCLVATHSTPFLALPTDDRGPLYVYVDRHEGNARCEQFDAGDLAELSTIVDELGFDRGELLTTVALFLIVEGIHEIVVLERIYGRELRAARIAMLPLQGISNAQAILETDVLWRYSTAEVALATDKFDRALLERVIADPEEAKALRKGDADEETKLLGQLIGNAQRNDTKIHLLGHRGADLIDVLDEKVIANTFERYPGHAEAQRLWKDARARGAKARQRKAFYEEQFAIPNRVESYMMLGDAHSVARSDPTVLRAMVDDAVALALGAATSAVVST